MANVRIGHRAGRPTQVETVYPGGIPDFVEVATDLPSGEILAKYRVVQTVSLIPREPMDVPAALSGVVGEDLTLAVPDPVEVTIGGVTQMVTGGTLQLSASAPDTFEVGLSAWPWLDATVTVTFAEAAHAD